MKTVAWIPLLILLVACGGAATPSARPSAGAPSSAASAPAASRPADSPPASSADAMSPEALCGLLTAADWQQFGYITGATPEVASEGPGSATCTFADELFVEVYTHAEPREAADTFDTILENVPFDEPQDLTLPGTEDVVFDPDTGDGNAGIAVRSGRLVYTISGLARETAQAELLALAGLVIQRGSHLI